MHELPLLNEWKDLDAVDLEGPAEFRTGNRREKPQGRQGCRGAVGIGSGKRVGRLLGWLHIDADPLDLPDPVVDLHLFRTSNAPRQGARLALEDRLHVKRVDYRRLIRGRLDAVNLVLEGGDL